MPRLGPDERLVAQWRTRREAGLTYERIAWIYGTTEQVVRRALGGGGRVGARTQIVDEERLVATYAVTGSIRQAAQALGVSRTLATRHLAEAGHIPWPDWLRMPDHIDVETA